MSNIPLEKYKVAGEGIPGKDWAFKALLDDIIMIEYADSDESGHVLRHGLYLATDATRAIWRVGVVRMKGPEVPEFINIGDHVMFPNDRGLQTILAGGVNAVFLNVDRIFAVVEPIVESTTKAKIKPAAK